MVRLRCGLKNLNPKYLADLYANNEQLWLVKNTIIETTGQNNVNNYKVESVVKDDKREELTIVTVNDAALFGQCHDHKIIHAEAENETDNQKQFRGTT